MQDGIAHEWAIEAGKLVFSEVETPTEDNLITFLTLGLFWSSQNDWKRLEIYSAATSGTFRALGLPASARLYDRSVRAELSRRRIWACFIVSQFSNWIDNLAMDIEDLKDIPMPSDGLDFETENIQGDSQIPAFFVHDRGTGGLFAELIRISCIWYTFLILCFFTLLTAHRSSVCRLAHNDKMIMDEKLPLIQKLSSELKEWKKGLPKCVDCSYASSGETVKQAQALTVHLIYHQTMCTLHSSIIPLFSFQPQEDGYGLFKSVSAQTALYHARQISTMFIQSSNWIGSFATGFMGYAAYCSTAVQIPFLWCQKESVRENARTNIIANLDALKAIGRHWKLIALLVGRPVPSKLSVTLYLIFYLILQVEYVPLLYRYHKKMAYSLSDEPHSLDETDLDRHQGRRVAARTSILGYNKVVQYRSQHQGSNETAKLELDFDDDREKADEDFQLSPNDPVAASAEVDSFDVNTDELLDGLYFEELFSGTTEMASADQYVSFFSQIDGSSFDAEQQLLLSSMDFPGML